MSETTVKRKDSDLTMAEPHYKYSSLKMFEIWEVVLHVGFQIYINKFKHFQRLQ